LEVGRYPIREGLEERHIDRVEPADEPQPVLHYLSVQVVKNLYLGTVCKGNKRRHNYLPRPGRRERIESTVKSVNRTDSTGVITPVMRGMGTPPGATPGESMRRRARRGFVAGSRP